MKFLDLFAGIGGFHLAVKSAFVGAECVAWCERDGACQKLYRAAHGGGMLVGDVRQVAVEVEVPAFDLLVGGFPCQPFSNVGLRQGLGDTRGELFFDITRILRTYRPQMFVLENVQKLVTLQQGRIRDQLREELEKCGYRVQIWDLTASQYGVPQKRRRLFFVGIRGAGALTLSAPSEIPKEQWRFPTAWHLLERDMPTVHRVPEKTRSTILRPNPKWMGDLQIDRAIARPLTATMAKWHRANQDNYYSETYIFGNDPDHPPKTNLDKEPIRRITPLEGFRLQGFPDHFSELARQEALSFSAQYRLIGNAVPVPMAGAVVRRIAEAS